MILGTDEEWRDIPGFKGYQAHWDGRIRSFRYRGKDVVRPVLLTPFRHQIHGAFKRKLYVKMKCADGKWRDISLIKVMADTWMGGCPDGMIPYHKNGITEDNCIHNIGFATRMQVGKLTGAKSRRIPVAKVNEAGDILELYPSAREAAKANYLSVQALTDRCNGNVKSEFDWGDGTSFRWQK